MNFGLILHKKVFCYHKCCTKIKEEDGNINSWKKLLLSLGLVLSLGLATLTPVDSQVSAQTPTINSVENPGGGSPYEYSGRISGHSVAYQMATKPLATAIGVPMDTVLTVFGVNSNLNGWLLEAYEPTPYAKIYTKVESSDAYGITFKVKYNWFYDSDYENYKTTTYRTESEDCGNYNYYCWKD